MPAWSWLWSGALMRFVWVWADARVSIILHQANAAQFSGGKICNLCHVAAALDPKQTSFKLLGEEPRMNSSKSVQKSLYLRVLIF